jgi:uncharacterized RDD family membrane protein YckC
MARNFEVVTPEHVAIRYELAGFGSRGIATSVDILLQGLVFVLVVLTLRLLAYLDIVPAFDKWTKSVLLGVGILLHFLISWGYYIFFETLWSGETPGKRVMGLRVIKDGGYPVDFRAVLIRNLMRAVDSFPAVCYAIGFIALLANEHYKRLGDMAAGTLVVAQRREEEAVLLPGMGETVMYRLLDATVLTQITRLDRDEYRMVKLFLTRRRELPQDKRGEFALRLAQPLIEKFNYKAPALGMDYERWLDELDLAYRSHALGIYGQPAAAVAPKAVTMPKVDPATPPPPPADGRKW